jgi:hypothetical protein
MQVLKHGPHPYPLLLMGLAWASDWGFDIFLSHHKQHGGSSGILLHVMEIGG